MSDPNTTPLVWLAQALAYIIEADNRVTFEQAQHIPVEKFIDEIKPALTPAQKVSVIINLYDSMLVDGIVVAGERKVLDLFINAFDISRNTVRAIREITLLKNDTGLFMDPDHPYNEPDYRLEIQLMGALEAEKPPELNYKPADKS